MKCALNYAPYPGPGRKLSSTKLAPGAKNVGDCCHRTYTGSGLVQRTGLCEHWQGRWWEGQAAASWAEPTLLSTCEILSSSRKPQVRS